MDIEIYKKAAEIMSVIYDYERYIAQVEEMRKVALDKAKEKRYIEIKISPKYIDDVMPIYDKMIKELTDKKEMFEKEFEEM